LQQHRRQLYATSTTHATNAWLDLTADLSRIRKIIPFDDGLDLGRNRASARCTEAVLIAKKALYNLPGNPWKTRGAMGSACKDKPT
jgi:hypothetical protein